MTVWPASTRSRLPTSTVTVHWKPAPGVVAITRAGMMLPVLGVGLQLKLGQLAGGGAVELGGGQPAL